MRMRKQHKSHKRSATGEKYIYIRKRGNKTLFRVSITRDEYKEKEKTFKTMGEAIEYRNAILASHHEEVV